MFFQKLLGEKKGGTFISSCMELNLSLVHEHKQGSPQTLRHCSAARKQERYRWERTAVTYSQLRFLNINSCLSITHSNGRPRDWITQTGCSHCKTGTRLAQKQRNNTVHLTLVCTKLLSTDCVLWHRHHGQEQLQVDVCVRFDHELQSVFTHLRAMSMQSGWPLEKIDLFLFWY